MKKFLNSFICRLNLLTILMSFLFISGLFCQDPVPFQPGSWIKANNVVPPSPQAASLGSYGNVPVNYYTGSPSINIPLYGIGGKYLSAPISLSYDPQSVRVATIPSWTGLGWTLQAGGVITRSVKGRPDLGNNFFNFESVYPQFAGMDVQGSSNLILENQFYYAVAGGAIETQPDVYYFNFPGYSGSFVILKNKTIVMRDYSELVINPIFGLNDDITGFTVIDPMGKIYQFMDAERSEFTVSEEMIDPPPPVQFQPYTYHSSWYLTSINSADGSENLTFVNEKVSTLNSEAFYLAPVNPFHNDSYSINNPDGGTDAEFCGNPQGTVSNGGFEEVKIFDRRYLKTITFSIAGSEAEKVEFSATAITESAGNPKSSGFKLDRIDIRRRKTSPSAKVLEFTLGYELGTVSRLMLKTVQENGYNGPGIVASKPPYTFTYFSGALPPVTSNQIDYWGFYNGADNNTLVPYVNIGGGIIINPNGANRRAAFDPRAVLQSIQYPLGGKTEFEYEGHQVPATGEVNVGSSIGGFRVRKITDKTENGAAASTRTFRYALDDASGTSSGKLLEFGDYFTESTFCHYGVPTLEDPQATATYQCNSFTVFASLQSALGSIQGSHIGYTRVEEVVGGDADHIGRQVYYFENSLSGGNLWETKNGTLLLAETYDKQSRMVRKTFNQYSYQEGPNCPGGCAGGSGLEVRSATSCDINNDTGGENSNNIQLCKTNSGFYEWRRLGFSYNEGCAEQQIFRAHFSRQGYLIKEVWQKLDWTESWDYFYDSGAQQQVYKKTNFEYTDTESGQPTAVYFTNSDGKVYRTEVEYYKNPLNNIKTIPKKVTKKTGSLIVGGTNQDLDQYGRTLKIYEILEGGSQLQRAVINSYQQGRPIDYKFMDHQTDQFLWESGLMTRHTKGVWIRNYDYYENRQLKSITEIDGLKTDFDYDKLLRLKEVKARSNNIVTTYTYLLGGPNQVQEQTVYSDAPTQTLVREFDGLGRPTKEIHNGVLKHQYFYDAFGRMDKETYLPGNFTEYLFDDSPLNRVIRQIFPDYSQTQTLYLAEGNHYRVTTRDEKGNPTTVDTDLLGRQTKIIDALGGTTVFVYDDAGNIKEVTSPAGQKYNYEYDQRHRLIFKKMPGEDKGRVMGYYDNDDLLGYVVDGNGARIDYEYDLFKRPTFTYLNTGINWTKGQTGTYGAKGSLIASNTYHPDGGGGITVNKLKESLVKMADLNGQITTWFDEYDAFGRLTKQREVYPLLQKASNTDQIEYTYNHADWLLREKRIHGGYTPLTTYRDHSYDQFGRMIFDGLFPDFSFETGLVYNMTYNDRDQMTTKKLGDITNPLDKVRFSYTERGWLSQMNDIVYQEVMADLCAVPPPSKPKQVEQEVDLEDLLDLIVSDPNLVIEGADPCVVSDCFERRASYRITVQNPVSADPAKYVNVDVCIEGLSGQTGLIPLPGYPYCLFAQNEVAGFIADLKAWMGTNGYIYDEITSSYNSATKTWTIDIVSTTYDFTGVEVECLRDLIFVIPQPVAGQAIPSHVTSIAYDGGTVPLGPYCWGTGGQLATQLKTWLQGAGFTVSNVTYVSGGRDIGQVKILGTNFPLSQVNLCIACLTSQDEICPKSSQIAFSSALTCLGTVEKRNQEIRQCKFPPGTNPGTDAQQPGSILDLDDIIDTSTPATIPLPNILYKVQLLDGSIRWVFKTELGTIKGQYTRLTEIPILSASQVFTIRKTNGQTIQTDLAGLLNERKLGTIDDIPVPPTTPPPGTDPCTPLSPLGCTDLEQQAQNQSLGQILNDMANLDVSTLQYPVRILLVRLCDGSTVYILEQFLDDLEGSHLVIGTITVNNTSQTFNVTAIQPEPIFAMAFNHEANGNISQAEWQTTFHRSQFYNYSYDALNRLSSGIYGEVVPSYNFVGGNFLKFAYQVNNNYNETGLFYDADGNFTNLTRMGLSDASNCQSEVQIDNLLYTYIPGTPKLQKVTDSAPVANRAKGFNPGTASGSAVYAYDKNGNLTTDPYKGITIQYNFLNLPKQINKGEASIVIRYDASGRKWSQTGTDGIREYVGGIEYVDQKIQSVQHGEGRLVADYNAGGTAIEFIRAEYWRQDHLGNIRVAFSDFNLDRVIATKDDPNTTGNDIEITQENHYYPFGLNHEGPWYQTVQPKNKYAYNGKEYVEDLGLNWNDYGARWYDAAVGRWGQLDKLAEKFVSVSPFVYTNNNPINFVDIDGNEFTEAAQAWVDRLTDEINKRIETNNSRVLKIQNEIAAGGLNENKVERLQNRIDKIQSENTSLSGVSSEIGALKASTQIYNIIESSSQNKAGAVPGSGTKIALTSFNSNTGNVDITLSKDAGLDLFAHELLHAYQFEIGETSLGNVGSLGLSFLLDKTDELAGYTRQGLLGSNEGVTSINNLPEEYNNLPSGPVNIHNYSPALSASIQLKNHTQLQLFANQKNQAFRINGQTYAPKK